MNNPFKYIITTLLISFCIIGSIQAQQWAFLTGDSLLVNGKGVYGVKGVESADNKPGQRQMTSLVYSNSAVWLFGGYGADKYSNLGSLSDLWKYNPSTNQWTWMHGPDTVNNVNGNYGTKGVGTSSTRPGSRRAAALLTDNQNTLWLFGGRSPVSSVTNIRNDLWKYETALNRWTWVNGSSSTNQNGNYGTIGVAAASNVPGSRYGCATWIDGTGKIWMYGGYGYDATGQNEKLSDLWQYNPTTNYWTFIKGRNQAWLNGTYGSLGVSQDFPNPGGRRYSSTWVDKNGNLYLFGGFGEAGPGNPYQDGVLNDLWKYTPSTNQWTWIHGDSTLDQTGIYGSKGIYASTNKPGAREGASYWVDNDGNFWLFGGYGFSSIGVKSYLNDLWKYNPTTNQWVWVAGQSTSNYYGTYGIRTVYASSNIPGSRAYSNATYLPNGNEIFFFGGQGYNAVDYDIFLNEMWKFNFNSTTTATLEMNNYRVIKVFPNPTYNSIYVQATESRNQTLYYDIIDPTGRCLQKGILPLSGEINISFIKNSYCFFRLSNKNGQLLFIEKIIIRN